MNSTAHTASAVIAGYTRAMFPAQQPSKPVTQYTAPIGPEVAPTDTDQTILDRIRDLVTSYVILPDEAYADILALYILHTHAFDAARTTPYIYITSQGPGSGKTRLMEVLQEVAKGGQMFAGGTGPTFFRLIEARRPTIFLDEVDTIYNGSKNEELRQVLNSGYKHNGSIPRVDQSSEDGIKDFSTFCPKVLAGIDNGNVPNTVLDRSIKITMERRTGEVAPFYSEDIEDLAEDLQEDIRTWLAANMDALRDRANRPAPIEGISDRQNDIIRPLLTIADRFIGWHKRARLAFVTAFREADAPLTPQASALAKVRDYVLAHNLDRITTAKVAELTNENGKQVANWFAAFGITAPSTYKFNDPISRADGQAVTSKGYKVDDAMTAAFARFLPALPTNV